MTPTGGNRRPKRNTILPPGPTGSQHPPQPPHKPHPSPGEGPAGRAGGPDGRGAWRAGRGIVLIHSLDELVAGDTVLYAVPLGLPAPEPGIVSA